MFSIVNYWSRKVTSNSILTSRNSVVLNNATKIDDCDGQVKFMDYIPPRKLNKMSKIDHNYIVTIVAIGAKWLSAAPDDGTHHKIFCKFSVGSESYKTKAVPSTIRPEWGERFKFHLHHDGMLKISVWDKAKQINFVGSCILDLSLFESERTHEIWKEIDDGYGMIHLSVTICLSSSSESSSIQFRNVEETHPRQRHSIFDFRSSWDLVGLLHVNVFGAKGLLGKPNAYCILELDNERVQTTVQKSSSKPSWNKCYTFNVYDVTSSLHIKLYNSGFLNEPVGKVSIPLLMITNGEQNWYALKDVNTSYSIKGNPRVCLQMTLFWNPLKASLRLFRPKPIKYVKKPKKFDVALVYSNIEFIGKMFNCLYEINECIKRLFEWDDKESSLLALIGWLVFCIYFRPWTVPLWLLLPFVYHWLLYRNQHNKSQFMAPTNLSNVAVNNNKVDNSLKGKLQNIQHTTLSVTNGIEYLANLSEKLYNLISFKVPFLSYLAMTFLLIASLVFYFIPFNYLLMILGIYKYTRKYLNPDRVLNNDLLDFISRIPNDEQLVTF